MAVVVTANLKVIQDIGLFMGSIITSQSFWSTSRNQKPSKPPCCSRRDAKKSPSPQNGDDNKNKRGIQLLDVSLCINFLGLGLLVAMSIEF